MDTTSLNKLVEEEGVICTEDGINMVIHPAWIVEGEDRLSYTTLVRLVECCREYHWLNDIVPKCNERQLDSICKSLTAHFRKPIMVGSKIYITYNIIEVRNKGYSIKFVIRDSNSQLYAEIDFILVFYDPFKRISLAPPHEVYEYLIKLCNKL
jgi:acyl-CoA thioesterase FadM